MISRRIRGRWTPLALVSAVSLAALASLDIGCGAPPRGVDWNGKRLPAIDMHLHPGDWDHVPEDTRKFLASRFPFPIGLDAEAAAKGSLLPESILGEIDDAGIWGAGLFAIYAPRTVGIASNELVAEDLTFAPDRFFGLASLRVDRWTTDRDAELDRLKSTLSRPGFVGIKLAHAHQHFRMDDPAFFPIYEIAASMGKPLYLHTGTSPFPGTSQEPAYTDPTYLETAIQQFPGAKFILGHLGYDFIEKRHAGLSTCIRLAKTYSNVFLEPSALGSASSDPTGENLKEAMRRMREAGITDRIIYGSDGPQSPGFVKGYLERTVAAMKEVGYTEQEAADVLAGNFARVFGVTIPAEAAE
ncbi:amidohydrolase family protein [Polyangium sp. y55x31]|uniref:amidohydrolase family protein n=1 Tax=Polyangium sp. y55x31 TaxID=3042688 RepID=UPI0024828146|nr:amidohydrolase family protein [Polyangium sp. y55x31]MDI1484399.1 amidohydrolase family protein [Polyangium sp. y55x31]